MTSGSCPALTWAPRFVVTESPGADGFTWFSEPYCYGDILGLMFYRQGHRRLVRRSHRPKSARLGPGRPGKATGLSPGSDTTAAPPHGLC